MSHRERYGFSFQPKPPAHFSAAAVQGGEVARLFQDLTDSEQACVSAKMSKLKDEGITGDQAVAIAIKMCAPSKATSKAAPEVDQAVDVPRYRADRATDGTYTIFDVPIFAAHNEVRKGEDREIEFGTAWLQGALLTAQTRQAEGYMAPLHVRHHGEGAPVEAAGKFAIRRVGPIMHDGQEVQALFADLVGVRPDVFQRIMRGELSYRSVEILDVNKQEIDSLALLDDEVPFFRFPLLRVAVAPSPPDGHTRVTLARTASGPARLYTAGGVVRGTAALFRFEADVLHFNLGARIKKLREDKEMTIEELAAAMSKMLSGTIDASTIGDIERGRIETPSKPTLGALAKVLGTTVAALTSKLPKGAEPLTEGRFQMTTPNGHTGAAPATDPSKKNANAEQLLMQIFSLIQQAMGQQAPEGPPNGMPNGMQPGQPAPPMAAHPQNHPQMGAHPTGQPQQGPGPVEQQPPHPPRAMAVGGVMGHFGAAPATQTVGSPVVIVTDEADLLAAEGAKDGLVARMVQLEAKFQAAETDNAIERRATELATNGYSTEQIAKFRGVAKEHGVNGGLIYARSLEDHGPSVPPTNWSGEIHGEAPDSPEVSKYAAQGPEVLAAARDHHRSWVATQSQVPFDDYFQANHNADAYVGMARNR